MVIEDLKGMELTHKKYGEVKVTDVIIDYSDMSSAIIEVDLGERKAKFKAVTMLNFFTDIPEELKPDILALAKPKVGQLLTEEKPNMKFINEDEFGNELTKNDWERSKKFVVSIWWSANELPSPVVASNKKVYISAKAACYAMGIPVRNYEYIYSVCNGVAGRRTYNGVAWRFAKIDDIDSVLGQLKDEQE